MQRPPRFVAAWIKSALFAAVVVRCALPASPVAAQTLYYWNGSDSSEVSDSANWDDGSGNAVGVPSAADSGDVIFSDYASNFYVDFNLSLSPDAVFFDYSTGTSPPSFLLTGVAGFNDASNTTPMSMNVTDPLGETVILGTSNSYCGPTTVQHCYLLIDISGALGTSTGAASARYTSFLDVDTSGKVDLYGSSIIVGGLASNDGTGIIGNNAAGTTSLLTVAFGANSKTGSEFSTSATFTGLIAGNGGTGALSAGMLAVLATVDASAYSQNAANFSLYLGGSSPNTYSGGTTITGPGQFRPLTVYLGGDQGLGLGPLTLGGQGCIFDLYGYDQTITSLTDNGMSGPGGAGHGTITCSAGASTLTVQLSSGTDSFAGTITNSTGAVLGLTLTGGGTLSLSAVNTFTAATTVSGGHLTISGAGSIASTSGVSIAGGAVLELASSVSGLASTVNVANSGTLLDSSSASQIVGTVTGTGNVTVNAGGSLTAYQIRQNSLTIGSGAKVTLAASGSGSTTSPALPNNINFSNSLTSLSIAGTMNAWTGTLDIGNNGLVIVYGTAANDPYATIDNMIESGYKGGVWGGTGITSSVAQAGVAMNINTPLNIGLVDFTPGVGNFTNETYFLFEGQTITTNAILIRLTYMDDLVLAGDLAQNNSTSDALIFAANFGSGTTWSVGDVTHDGKIDSNDALLFAANFVVGLPSLDGSAGNDAALGGSPAAVPEPSSIFLAAPAALGLALLARRRRSLA